MSFLFCSFFVSFLFLSFSFSLLSFSLSFFLSFLPSFLFFLLSPPNLWPPHAVHKRQSQTNRRSQNRGSLKQGQPYRKSLSLTSTHCVQKDQRPTFPPFEWLRLQPQTDRGELTGGLKTRRAFFIMSLKTCHRPTRFYWLTLADICTCGGSQQKHTVAVKARPVT